MLSDASLVWLNVMPPFDRPCFFPAHIASAKYVLTVPLSARNRTHTRSVAHAPPLCLFLVPTTTHSMQKTCHSWSYEQSDAMPTNSYTRLSCRWQTVARCAWRVPRPTTAAQHY